MSEQRPTQLGDIKGPLELQREVNRIIGGLDIETVFPSNPPFRPGTELPVIKYNMYFRGSGMGDYICYMPAMVWLAKNSPWIHGHIFVAEFFNEFAKNIMDQTGQKGWQVYPIDRFEELKNLAGLTRGPGITQYDKPTYQLVNGSGGHLVTLGFMYFANLFPPPTNADYYPIINFEGWQERHDLYYQKYVVFTPGAVSAARTVPGHYWNPIIEHVKSKGLTPVFLGTRKMVELNVNFPDGLNYADGIDLRDKTTMMEAAWVMKNSACVVGLDNGLIHLAACTDAPIVAGYNMVHPRDRRPKRWVGKWREIALTQKDLSCAGCQSEMKSMFPHNFARCLYDDLKCLDILFANGADRWIWAIDKILSS
jgi:ADP-heptose:LPS heptosyltransferase